MTYDEYEGIAEDLLYAFNEGEISETQYEKEIDALAEQWDEEGEQ